MSVLPIGKRVAVVSGPHFNEAGSVVEQPSGFPQWYVLRLDGGQKVRVTPAQIAEVRP